MEMLLDNYVRDNHAILDIGSGTGKVYEIVRGKHKNCIVHMVDFSEKMCAIAMTKSYLDTKARVFCINLNDFKPCKKYDVITSLQVIHHIPSIGNFLTNCLRLMNNNGVLLIQTVGNGYLKNIFGRKTKTHILDILGRFSRQELECEIKTKDLEIESFYSDEFKFHFNNKQDVVKFIELIGTVNKINGYTNNKVPKSLKKISTRIIDGEYNTMVLRKAKNDK
ncbi:methyltransferase [Vibrio mimicus]